MATISREAIQALARNRPAAEVPIPGSDERARLRKISIAEYRKFTAYASKEGTDDAAAAAEMLQLCWVDEAGNPMFVGSEGRTLLEELPAEILSSLFTAAIEFSGVKSGAVEAAEKNS